MVGDSTKGDGGLPPKVQFKRVLGGIQWRRRRKTRAPGHVSTANENPFHLSREWQCDEGHRKVMEKRGTGEGVSQGTKRAGKVSVGPKQCVGAQNNLGISVREEGAKYVGSRVSKKESLGRQTRKWGAQNLSPTLGTIVGQSPSCYKEQKVWFSVGNDRDNERVKGTGLGKEKTEGVENYCLVSLQRSEDTTDEAKEPQENNTTQTVGQKELNNRERGTSREESRNPREAIGIQNAEKGRSFRDSDRESFSGKFLKHKISISVGGVGSRAEVFNAGEKKQSSLQASDCLCNIQAEVGFKPSSCPPSIPGETSKKLGLEVEEVFNTRVVRKVWIGTKLLGQQEVTRLVALGRLQNQDLKNHESSRVDGAICGSGSIDVSDLGSGRILSRAMGVGLDRMGPSPSKAGLLLMGQIR